MCGLRRLLRGGKDSLGLLVACRVWTSFASGAEGRSRAVSSAALSGTTQVPWKGKGSAFISSSNSKWRQKLEEQSTQVSHSLGKSAFGSRIPQVRGCVSSAWFSCAPLTSPAAADVPLSHGLLFPFSVGSWVRSCHGDFVAKVQVLRPHACRSDCSSECSARRRGEQGSKPAGATEREPAVGVTGLQ